MDNELENPFASPLVDDIVATNAAETPDEQIRRKYVRHEVSLKAIGGAIALAAAVAAPICVLAAIRTLWQCDVFSDDFLMFATFFPIIVAFCIWQIAAGMGLRKLKNNPRIAAGFFSVLWMWAFPLGTLLGIFFLCMLLSPKSVFVCSDEYQRIIAATPHIKVRTSPLMWAVSFLLVALFAISLFSFNR
ncbi:MAG: hypothetical protein R3C28_15460 [Pirellulaceae bacterium]